MLKLILMAGTGGFLGTVTRFLASRYIHLLFPTTFPLGTFVVNIAGCFILGLLYGLAEKESFMSPDWRIFLTVGFCGGFTTFSTFAAENITFLRDGNLLHFAMYSGLSVMLGIAATYLGSMILMKCL